MLHFPGIVPRLSKVTAATDMPDGVDKPTVEERDEAALELDRDGNAVRAVTIEETGRGSVYRGVLVMDDANRDACSIWGRCMEE